MKSSLALVECLLILRAFGTRGVSLFSGVFSGSGVDSPPLVACFLMVSQSLSWRGCSKEHLHFADR